MINLSEIRSRLTYSVLANFFFDLVKERYPSNDKIKQSLMRLTSPLTKDPIDLLNLNIAFLSLVRLMIKEVDPRKLYRSLQHRDDLYMVVIETLEEFEDELQDLEEQLAAEEENE